MFTETQLLIPRLCTEYNVPHKVLRAPQVGEEALVLFDPASISITLSKKYKIPFGRLRARISNSTDGNRIIGSVNHRDCVDLQEITVGGYLILNYCGLGAEIMVYVPKHDFTGDWEDFI